MTPTPPNGRGSSPARALLLPLLPALLVGLAAFGAPPRARAQSLDFDRSRARQMLGEIKDDLKKRYYDASYRGMDVEARFHEADEKMKTATSNGQLMGIIAQVLIELNDSHTFFIPPSRAARVEYGWEMQVVGDDCYVTAVRPGSDAEAKGLKPGDRVLEADGYQIVRDNFWKFQYLYNTLRPQPGISVVVQSPGGQPRRLDLLAKVQQRKRVMDLTGSDIFELVRDEENESRLYRHRYVELGDDLFVWKMPQFDLDEAKVKEMMGKVRRHKALILDLRGNPGGYVKTLEWLAGHFFDHEVKVADLRGRKEMKPITAKPAGNPFTGQLVVLVDSRSASAAELFSRLMQLEKRGTVIGDRTAGAVMQSEGRGYQMGTDVRIFYGASITNADVIMTDGKSLEHVGVTPDELRLPAAQDIAARRDPVLARAAEVAGVKLDPEKAGALFPVEWKPMP